MGWIYEVKKHDAEAIQHYKEAVRLDPKYSEAYFGLGNIYYNAKKNQESLPFYEKAVELKPKWVTAIVYLGDNYYRLKRYNEAKTQYTNAIHLDTNSDHSYFGLGLIHIIQNNKTAALQQYEKLKPLNSNKAEELLKFIKPMR